MSLLEPATRLTIYVGESDQWEHHPLYTEIVHRAHAAGLGGASVFRGIEGFGASSRIHTTRLLSLSEDLPVMVVLVSSPERIRAFLPQVEELVTNGLVTIDQVEVVTDAGRPDRTRRPASTARPDDPGHGRRSDPDERSTQRPDTEPPRGASR